MRAARVVLAALGLVAACAVPAEAIRDGSIRELTKQERMDDLVVSSDAVVVATIGSRYAIRPQRCGGPPEFMWPMYVDVRPRRVLKGERLPSKVRLMVKPGSYLMPDVDTDIPQVPVALLALQLVRFKDGKTRWALAQPSAGPPYRALGADSATVIAEVESAIRRQSLDSLAIEADFIGVLRESGGEQIQQVVETIAGEWPANERRLARVFLTPRPGLKLVFGRYTEEVTRLPGGPVWIEPLHMDAGEMEIADGIVQPLNQPLDSVILRIRMLRLAHGRPAPRAARH